MSNDGTTETNYALGFLLTLVAGCTTMLGAAFIPALKWGSHDKVTAGALGFAAGVMLYVSLVDVLGEEAEEFFGKHFKAENKASCRNLREDDDVDIQVRIWITVFFVVGLEIGTVMFVIMASIPSLVSSDQNTQGQRSAQAELRCLERSASKGPCTVSTSSTGDDDGDLCQPSCKGSSLERVSAVAFIALTLHNIPEGLATFLGGGTGSFTVPFAIAMHNIPEGAAIAIPSYQASGGDLLKAMRATLVASLAQPVGAAIGWLLISVIELDAVSDFFYGAMYSVTAGIMVCISLIELIPEAVEAATPRFASFSVILGFFVMGMLDRIVRIVLLGTTGS
jgi:ZIP family zinc transporter